MTMMTMRRIKYLLMFCCASFALATCILVIAGLNDTIANADLIVVPGNAVKADGTPGARLQARLDVALSLYRAQRAPLIFVSGGTGKAGFDEAVSMSNYLVSQGVPANAIVKDGLGIDTFATGKNAAAFMRANRLESALVATQYFHIQRTKFALELHGVKVTGTAHAHFFELRDLYSIPRETIGYLAYFFRTTTQPIE